jgi:16S rRNA (cytidine1402-2'-O)-methyltransferase
MSMGTVLLIPTVLDEDGMDAIPAYVRSAVESCEVFFVENERTARRFLKSVWREMVIDQYEWFPIHKAEDAVVNTFRDKLKSGKTIGILSEAGCPGVADPGQYLVAAAQELNALIKPLVGPNSILLALMASGMNGQHFQFVGYLPIDAAARIKMLKELEAESKKKNCTQIFIETPYRNNQLLEVIVRNCQPETMICIAADLTGKTEFISTKSVANWKKETVQLHKRPAIFLLYSLGRMDKILSTT